MWSYNKSFIVAKWRENDTNSRDTHRNALSTHDVICQTGQRRTMAEDHQRNHSDHEDPNDAIAIAQNTIRMHVGNNKQT